MQGEPCGIVVKAAFGLRPELAELAVIAPGRAVALLGHQLARELKIALDLRGIAMAGCRHHDDVASNQVEYNLFGAIVLLLAAAVAKPDHAPRMLDMLMPIARKAGIEIAGVTQGCAGIGGALRGHRAGPHGILGRSASGDEIL